MASKLQELFLIQKHEKRPYLYLLLLSFLTGLPQITSLTASTTLFLRSYTASDLPLAYLLSSLLLGAFSLSFVFLGRAWSTRGKISFLFAFLLLITAGLKGAFSLFPNQPILDFAAFLWSRLENALMAVTIITISNAFFGPRASGRLSASASSGQVISLVLGGFLLRALLPSMAIQDLYYFSLGSYALCLLLAFFVFPKSSEIPHPKMRKTPYSLGPWLLVTIGVMYLVYFTVDTVFLGTTDQNFNNSGELASFISLFWIVTGTLAILIKLFLTGRLLAKLSNPFGLFLPILGLGIITLSGISQALPSALFFAVLLKAGERVLDGSFFLPSFYGLIQGLDKDQRFKTQVLSETLVGPGIGGLAGAGLLLWSLSSGFSPVYLTLILGGLLILWLFPSFVVSLRYFKNLKRLTQPLPIKRVILEEKIQTMLGHLLDSPEKIMHSLQSTTPRDDAALRKSIHKAIAHAVVVLHFLQSQRINWIPLENALRFELLQIQEKLLREISLLQNNPELLRRGVYVLKNAPSQRSWALEGLAPYLPRGFRTQVLGVLEENEVFLFTKRVPRIPLRDFVSTWTREVLGHWELGDYFRWWSRQYRDLLSYRRSEFFSAFPLEYLVLLYLTSQKQKYTAGETLIAQGDHGDFLILLLDGAVEVQRDGKTLTTFTKGSCFGEMSLIKPGPRSASIVATQDCAGAKITASGFIPFLEDHPMAIRQIMTIMQNRQEAFIENPEMTIFEEEDLEETDYLIPSAQHIELLVGETRIKKISKKVLDIFWSNSRIKTLARGDSLQYQYYKGLFFQLDGFGQLFWEGKRIERTKPGDMLVPSFRTAPLPWLWQADDEITYLYLSPGAFVEVLWEDPHFLMKVLKSQVDLHRHLLESLSQ
jgi:CRP-like cAMP-binding protein